jgi:hypothetical protein
MASNRRSVLAVLGLGLAGCLGGNDSNSEQSATSSPSPSQTPTATKSATPTATRTSTPTPTETSSPTPTESPTATPTPTPQPASFELVEYNSPESVSINETAEITATVENTGEVAGVFSAEVYVRFDASEQFSPLDDPVEAEIPPGGQVEITIAEYQPLYTDEALEARLGDFEETLTVNAVSATLEYGTTFTQYDGYLINLSNPRLTQSYTSEGYTGGEEEESAPEGSQWLFVSVLVENGTGETELSPLSSDFSVLAGNSQFDPAILVPEPVEQGQPYDGGELQPGVVREGYIGFEIDAGLSLDDLQIVYTTQTIDGEVTVYWQSERRNSLQTHLRRSIRAYLGV